MLGIRRLIWNLIKIISCHCVYMRVVMRPSLIRLLLSWIITEKKSWWRMKKEGNIFFFNTLFNSSRNIVIYTLTMANNKHQHFFYRFSITFEWFLYNCVLAVTIFGDPNKITINVQRIRFHMMLSTWNWSDNEFNYHYHSIESPFFFEFCSNRNHLPHKYLPQK